MKFAICNETFLDWPFDRAFAFARECGYTGVEFAPFTLTEPSAHFHVDQVIPQRRREVRQQAEDAGLEVIGLHWLLAKTEGFHLTSPDSSIRRATAEYLTKLAVLCRDLGGSIMVLGSPQQRNLLPGVTHDVAMQHAADVLRGAMYACEQQGVTVALEPLAPSEGDFLLTAQQGVALVEMVDSPFCRLHLDCKAMSTEAQPIEEVIRANKDYLIHFHANDANLQGPGMGEVDFVPIFGALNDIDYSGWVSVEVFDYAPGVERLVRESIEYIKRVTRRADS